MFKKILMGVCAFTLMGAGFTAVMAAEGAKEPGIGCPGCEASEMKVITAVAVETKPAEKAVDVKNTKCLVMKDEDVSDKTVEHNGKIYHICCGKCLKAFKADPDKYIKAFEADKAAYGVK